MTTKPSDPAVGAALDERQRRERDYHEAFAARQNDRIDEPVLLDVIEPGPRRPWNGYWSTYDLLLAEGLAGKRILIPGCGFGEDSIRLATLKAEVHAFDLSPALVDVARARAAKLGLSNVTFDIMPAEALTYEDNFFDLVFFNDILHHVDIPKAVAEASRVLKPGGRIIANELYTHSLAQRIRESRFVAGFLYGRMVRFVYGTNDPYITEDEHKINEAELAILTAILRPPVEAHYFMFLGGRLLPGGWPNVARFDRAFLRMSDALGALLAGRVVIAGTVAKPG